MYIPYQKIYFSETKNEYALKDLTGDEDTSTSNVPCISIEQTNDIITKLEFGYMAAYKFVSCPIWVGSILVNQLIKKEDNYIFSFSYRSKINKLLGQKEIRLLFEDKTNDGILKYFTKLINFLIYILKRTNLYDYREIEDLFQKDFNNIPFNFSKKDFFQTLHAVNVEVINTIVGTESNVKVKISNFSNFRTYIIVDIASSLARHLPVSEIKLLDNGDLVAKFSISKQIKLNKYFSLEQNIISLVKEIIMFGFGYDEYNFYYTIFNSNNESPQVTMVFMQLCVLYP